MVYGFFVFSFYSGVRLLLSFFWEIKYWLETQTDQTETYLIMLEVQQIVTSVCEIDPHFSNFDYSVKFIYHFIKNHT